MRSMTGFGRASATRGACTAQLELSTVNRKTLDLQLSLPPGLTPMEAELGTILRTSLHRGRVQFRVRLQEAESGAILRVDQTRVEQILREVNALAEQTGLQTLADVRDVLMFPGVWQEVSPEGVDSDAAEAVRDALEEALKNLVRMREHEGAQLKARLLTLLERLQETVTQVRPLVSDARVEQEARLREKVEALGDVGPEMQTRLYQEVVLFAEKTDVQEEIDRLEAHVNQMREKLEEEGPVGRGLDFLCQEMARECNTLSVKASRTDINQCALQGKELVEQLREQVQNIE